MAKTQRSARDRIIEAATELFHSRGLKGASVDEILRASGTGKGQFAHYFKNKEGLALAVVEHLERLIKGGVVESNYILKTWTDFDGWFPRYIEFQRAVGCELSCPLGTIGNDLTSDQAQLRRQVRIFFEWSSGQLARFFSERQAARELPEFVNPDALADLCLAVMEGGMLLSKISRNTAAFENAAAEAVRYVQLLRKMA